MLKTIRRWWKKSGSKQRRLRPALEQLESRLAPATITWRQDAGTNDWHTAANWVDSAGPPTADDDVVIHASTGNPPTIGAGNTGHAGKITFTGADPAEEKTLTVNGTLNVGANATSSTSHVSVWDKNWALGGTGTFNMKGSMWSFEKGRLATTNVNIGGGFALYENFTEITSTTIILRAFSATASFYPLLSVSSTGAGLDLNQNVSVSSSTVIKLQKKEEGTDVISPELHFLHQNASDERGGITGGPTIEVNAGVVKRTWIDAANKYLTVEATIKLRSSGDAALDGLPEFNLGKDARIEVSKLQVTKGTAYFGARSRFSSPGDGLVLDGADGVAKFLADLAQPADTVDVSYMEAPVSMSAGSFWASGGGRFVDVRVSSLSISGGTVQVAIGTTNHKCSVITCTALTFTNPNTATFKLEAPGGVASGNTYDVIIAPGGGGDFANFDHDGYGHNWIDGDDPRKLRLTKN